ncbi:MAG: hypothetical protein LC114_04290 [Bryobacterales bacterium]|nr:hypothetical protein [Bryobacterales bacterium]
MTYDVVIEAYAAVCRTVTVEVNDEESAKVAALNECEELTSSDFELECPAAGYELISLRDPEAIVVWQNSSVGEKAEV